MYTLFGINAEKFNNATSLFKLKGHSSSKSDAVLVFS